MKNPAIFSSKDKSKKLKCRLLQFLFSALRVIFFSSPVCLSSFEMGFNKACTLKIDRNTI